MVENEAMRTTTRNCAGRTHCFERIGRVGVVSYPLAGDRALILGEKRNMAEGCISLSLFGDFKALFLLDCTNFCNPTTNDKNYILLNA